MRSLIFVIIASLSSALAVFAADKPVVHEWGTFTCLQDEAGQPLGGINADDEPLPSFVHDLISQNAGTNKGGVPACFPSVTMRLETPVL
jgi:hypothetical protein